MAKTRIGIVGYGNLGRAVENLISKNENFTLVKIFSKRKGLVSPLKSSFELTENLESFKNKIDILFLCGGSYKDIEEIGPRAIKNFNTIDCFDTHAKLEKYISSLDKLAVANNKIAISACGWDPGLFSLMRIIFGSISPEASASITFWGKGVSQGHSDAIRRIEGVADAIQYTIPNESEVKKVQTKPGYIPKDHDKHTRECFVVLKENADPAKIKNEIVTMQNYFVGYDTSVKFVRQAELNKMKEKMFHKGTTIKNYTASDGNSAKIEFDVDLESNPSFTAQIMIAYSQAIVTLKKLGKPGAYSIFEIAPSYLYTNMRKGDMIKNYL